MDCKASYLDLIKKSLTGALDIYFPERWSNSQEVEVLTREHHLRPMSGSALTMLGINRLDFIQQTILNIVNAHIPGDILIAGCWRGGLAIFCQACLRVYEPNSTRNIWCADTFVAKRVNYLAAAPLKILAFLSNLLPSALTRKIINGFLAKQGFAKGLISNHDLDLLIKLFKVMPWRGSHSSDGGTLAEMLTGFKRYGLWAENIKPLQGFFENTLPTAPISELSIIFSDGDFYQSTLDSLIHTYSKLAQGGYAIVDDYGALSDCKLATDEFRSSSAIRQPLQWVDHSLVYWVK